jgi:2-hydroxycyclohexanecarboxyl-CoA dehydrogenase
MSTTPAISQAMSADPEDRRVAAVVGAAGVLGGAVVTALAERGWAVAGFDVTASEAERSAVLDVCDRELVAREVEAARAQLGEIECLIALPGAPDPTPVAEVGFAEWRETLRAELLSVANFAWALLPGMLERGAGSIVAVSSDTALGAPGTGVHNAAAAGAVLGFTRALAIELAKTGVQVNAISTQLPGSDEPSDSPLGREVRPHEIAATAVYLAHEKHFFLGQVLAANGGRVI